MPKLLFEPVHLRCTGRSTRQMQAAPRNALYLVNREQMRYARDLAHKHGRDDLKIADANQFFRDNHYKGVTDPVIVDHCLDLSREEFTVLQIHNSRIETK